MKNLPIFEILMQFITSIKSTTIAFLGTWTLLATLIIVLRVVRIQFQTLAFGIFGKYVYVSDIVFLLAFLLIGLLILFFIRNAPRILHRTFLGFLIPISLILAAVEIIACRFYTVSGATIDAGIVQYTFQNLVEVRWAVSVETPLWLSISLIFGFALLVLTPLIVAKKWEQCFGSTEPRQSKIPYLIFAILGCSILFFAMLSPSTMPAFGINATTLIAKTALSSHEEDDIAPPKEKIFETKGAILSGDSKTNLVIILLESTRASGTSLHAPFYPTTPFLKELSKNSLYMERAYTVVPHTSKALVSVLCGIPPSTPMPIIEAIEGSIPGRCLAELLRKKGYGSAYFQSAKEKFEGRPGLIKNIGFQNFFPLKSMPVAGFERVNSFGYEDDIMVEPSRDWLRKNKDAPFFLTYLTLTPHHNYKAPKKYGIKKYVDDASFNDYLNAIHYVDEFTKNIFTMFKEEGLYENTVFVLVGDHGEGFGEHDYHQHDSVIWEEGIHIPMMVHKAGEFPDGKKVNRITNQLDILPTVLPLMGFEIENAKFPGADLRTLNEDRSIFVHCWYDRKCIAALKGDEKYIYHFGILPEQFFNIAKDPLEKENLRPTYMKKWKKEALQWRAGVNAIYREHAETRLSDL